MKTLSDEDYKHLSSIMQKRDMGEPLFDDEIEFFLTTTYQMDKVLRCLSPAYLLVANDIMFKREEMSRWAEHRARVAK